MTHSIPLVILTGLAVLILIALVKAAIEAWTGRDS